MRVKLDSPEKFIETLQKKQGYEHKKLDTPEERYCSKCGRVFQTATFSTLCVSCLNKNWSKI